jgi:radical SAM-linked protein
VNRASHDPVQRLQVRFTRGEQVKYLSHLDLMRLWHRALRRANLPVHCSRGFNPHLHMSMAVPLAVGVCGWEELMDVFMIQRVHPTGFQDQVNQCLPSAVRVTEVLEVPAGWPSLTSRVRFADYRVTVHTDFGPEELAKRIRNLLDSTALPRERKRNTEIRRYDLRPLVEGLSLTSYSTNDLVTLDMRLRTDQSGSGRPEEVVLALGLDLIGMSAIRTRLILAEPAI